MQEMGFWSKSYRKWVLGVKVGPQFWSKKPKVSYLLLSKIRNLQST